MFTDHKNIIALRNERTFFKYDGAIAFRSENYVSRKRFVV